MKTRVLLMLFCSFCFIGCQIKPEPIDFGTDACHFCRMNIVSKQHASEIVTKKGKVYKYDAIECMLNDLKDRQLDNVSLFLVMDYTSPGNFVDATKATYLVSPNIPSPMNGFLSAFSNENQAIKMKAEKRGELYTWERIKAEKFDIIPNSTY